MEKESNSWFDEEQSKLNKILNQQFLAHILFGVSGRELTENSVRRLTIEEALDIIDGQTDTETNKTSSGGTQPDLG